MQVRKRFVLVLVAVSLVSSGCDDGGEGPANDRAATILALSANATAGATVFANHDCSTPACHGDDGDSGMAGAPMLSAIVPSRTDRQMLDSLLNGKGGMPSQGALADQELADALAWLDEEFGN